MELYDDDDNDVLSMNPVQSNSNGYVSSDDVVVNEELRDSGGGGRLLLQLFAIDRTCI